MSSSNWATKVSMSPPAPKIGSLHEVAIHQKTPTSLPCRPGLRKLRLSYLATAPGCIIVDRRLCDRHGKAATSAETLCLPDYQRPARALCWWAPTCHSLDVREKVPSN